MIIVKLYVGKETYVRGQRRILNDAYIIIESITVAVENNNDVYRCYYKGKCVIEIKGPHKITIHYAEICN